MSEDYKLLLYKKNERLYYMLLFFSLYACKKRNAARLHLAISDFEPLIMLKKSC